MHDDFPPGLYDLLSTPALRDRLRAVSGALWSDVDEAELRARLIRHISDLLAETLAGELAGGRATILSEEILQKAVQESIRSQLVPDCSKALRHIPRDAATPAPDYPQTPLSTSALLTGASRSPALRVQLQRELSSCDRADWLVSFIKWSGLRPLMESLRAFTQEPAPDGGPRLRVATTSYMGATDAKAVEELLNLPNVEVRVSYDTRRTRLHAKAYLFHRRTGFGSAYIGSANVSRAALDEGLEWTAKISQYELPYLWNHAKATFESHWQDESEFTPCRWVDLPRLRAALQGEDSSSRDAPAMFFDLRPFEFQRTILEDLADERQAGIKRHLVVAATGTGKTMIAAFDYRRFCEDRGGRPRLLFLAHREELLRQAIGSFRQVLRDGSFGDIKTGATTLPQHDHVFCTIQCWERHLGGFEADHFAYVVFDEAHHARAATYQRAITWLKPECLLGLTATPERMDGQDIRDDFGGRYTHEIRLAEAVDRALLSPFHYYGIPDAEHVDLSRLSWRGGYDGRELTEQLANDERARWVLGQTDRYLTDIRQARVLGFCASIAHAEFMASYFNAQGIASLALSSQTSRSDREQAKQRLTGGDLQVVFVVDLYNEGVDIPEVDTVLFLRPTESLTVFLQQLGRGLRLSETKAQLTVLDFIAPQHRNFRYADRFQALSSRAGTRIDKQIEAGMPYVPTGCVVQLEKRAREIVLGNIKQATARLARGRIKSSLRELYAEGGSAPELQAILDTLMLDDPDQLYAKALPSALLAEVLEESPEISEKEAKAMQNGFRRLLSCDDSNVLNAYEQQLEQGEIETDLAAFVHTVLWGQSVRPSLRESKSFIAQRPGLRRDLLQLLRWQSSMLPPRASHFVPNVDRLQLHHNYTRQQILLAVGKGSFDKPQQSREGVLHVADRQLEIFFADIHKSEADFSPTTMYEDYAITDSLFHWQSQAATHAESPVGQRYIHHVDRGVTPLLFIRERKKRQNGITSPYFFAGPLRYQSHSGNRPISFIWELEESLPSRALRWARQVG